MASEPTTRDAGDFGSWLRRMTAVLDGHGEASVACGSCVACCSSSQFVHVDPDETATREQLPRDLLVPAPGLPAGHSLLGYDEQGRCPMLGGAGCTVYAHRPRACRAYDCRVLAAAGVDVARDGKPLIAAAAARWRFSYAEPDDRTRHDAVRAAARLLTGRPDLLPAGIPTSATAIAVVAVRVHAAFLEDAASVVGTAPGERLRVRVPDPAEVARALAGLGHDRDDRPPAPRGASGIRQGGVTSSGGTGPRPRRRPR